MASTVFTVDVARRERANRPDERVHGDDTATVDDEHDGGDFVQLHRAARFGFATHAAASALRADERTLDVERGTGGIDVDRGDARVR